MKKLFLFLFTVALIVSCETDTTEAKKELETSYAVKSFTNATVGSVINGEVVIKANNILEVAQAHSDKFDLDMTPESYKVIEVDERMFLRVFNTDGSAITVALKTSSAKGGGNPSIGTGDIGCKTTVCASSGGCIPDAADKYCTKCINPATGNQSLDCTRS